MSHVSKPYKPWTEEVSRNLVPLKFSQRGLKTAPAAYFRPINGIDPRKRPFILWGDVYDDAASPISTASGPSASPSSPGTSSRELELSESSISLRCIQSERHRNTTYASQIPMFEFRKDQGHYDWNRFAQTLNERLPEKLVHQNGSFQLIDYGGSGHLYATAFQTKRSCDTLAIKVLRKKNAEMATDLPAELQIMSRLRHNHIVALVSYFQRKGQLALLMYPVAICNLAEYLNHISENNHSGLAIDPLRSRTLLKAFGCLASAVLYLHGSQKVKHKDIKPENILVTKHESVLLADFGCSKKYEADTTTEGPTPFTDKYAPPEVIVKGKRNMSSDIWSLGCVFLEMMTVLLGQSLANLSETVFSANDRPSYRDSPEGVRDWVNLLKDLVEELTNLGISGPMFENQIPTVQHLDMIHRMISDSPKDRPSISSIHKEFRHFASQCVDCQSSDWIADDHTVNNNIEILPAILTEMGPIRCRNKEFLFTGLLSFLKSKLQMTDDTAEDADYSEDDSIYSDSDMDDEPGFSETEAERHIKDLLQLYFCYLKNPGKLQGIRCCPTDGQSGNRRQPSPMPGRPSKRRATSSRRPVDVPRGDDNNGNDEGDDNGDPIDRRGKQGRTGSDRRLATRLFACPYRKYAPNRNYGGHDCDAGWFEIPRLKEHLFRVHRIYPCHRCQRVFTSDNDRTLHLREPDSCPLNSPPSDTDRDWGEGFDDGQATGLKSRSRNVPGEVKWRRYYKILFPDVLEGDIPSPYKQTDEPEQLFSALDRTDSPSSRFSETQLREVIGYLAQVLPQVFPQALPYVAIPHQQNATTIDNVNYSNVHGGPQHQVPQLLQQATPEQTQTNLESGQALYSERQPTLGGFTSNGHYSTPQSLAPVPTSSHVAVSITRDSSYYTNDTSTHRSMLPQGEYRPWVDPPSYPLGGSPSLNGAGAWQPVLGEYDINDFNISPGDIPDDCWSRDHGG